MSELGQPASKQASKDQTSLPHHKPERMRPSSYLALLAPAALVAVVSAEPAPKLSPLIVNFDEKLEGRTGTYEKVEDVVGKLSLESKFAPNSHNESAGGEGGDVRARDATQELTARTVLDVLLNRRQYCNTGYGYCSSECPRLVTMRREGE